MTFTVTINEGVRVSPLLFKETPAWHVRVTPHGEETKETFVLSDPDAGRFIAKEISEALAR